MLTERFVTPVGLAVVGLLAVVTSSDAALFPRALDTKAEVDSAIAVEDTLFSRNERSYAPDGASWFSTAPGSVPVLLVAGHATCPTRNGKLRFADGGTGGLAIALHELTHAPAIYTTFASPSDPNDSDDNAFKETLARLVHSLHPRLVLDLHGSDWDRPYDVDFGTMHGRSALGRDSLLEDLGAQLRGVGIFNLSQDYWAAEKQQTVTKWVVGLGVPCVQLEINSIYLSPGRGGTYRHDFSRLLEGLGRFIGDVAADSARTQ